MTTIQWRQREDQTWVGSDDENNVYYQPGNRETTYITLLDGRTGSGWTPEEALTEALNSAPAGQLFYVDIPADEDDDGTRQWTNLGHFPNRPAAVAWIREHIDPNCDDEGRVNLITMGGLRC